MSVNSFIKKALYSVGVTLWVVVSLFTGQVIASVLPYSLLVNASQTAQTTIEIAVGYSIGLAIAIGVPRLIKKKKISKEQLGIKRLPSWWDILLSIASVVPYYVLAAAVVWFGTSVLHVINPSVGQQIPFSHVATQLDYVLVFATFVVMAPLAEELLFRGYLLGKLNTRMSRWLAVLVTAAVFGLLHLPGVTENGTIVWQWGAVADTFTMGLAAGTLRQLTDNVWAGMLLHGIKNAVAFYFLFINPLPPGGM